MSPTTPLLVLLTPIFVSKPELSDAERTDAELAGVVEGLKAASTWFSSTSLLLDVCLLFDNTGLSIDLVTSSLIASISSRRSDIFAAHAFAEWDGTFLVVIVSSQK